MTDKPVLIRYETGPFKDAEYEIGSAELATKTHPDATIVQYMDGSKFEAVPVTPAAPGVPVVAPTLPTPIVAPPKPAGTV